MFNNKLILISYREVLTFMDLFFNKILFDYERRNDIFENNFIIVIVQSKILLLEFKNLILNEYSKLVISKYLKFS